MTIRLRSPVLTLLLALLLALVVLGVLRQANPLLNFPSLDSGYYLYFGQQLLAGKTLYMDLWDSKPPGIFYVDMLGLGLARGSRWGVWLIEFAALFGSSALSYYLLRKIYGFLPALAGSLAWLWALNPILQGGNLTEEYSLPFNFLALLAFWHSLNESQGLKPKNNPKWAEFIIGLTFAASFLLRPNNTGVQVAIVLAWLAAAVLQKEYKRFALRLLWSGLGVVLGLGLVSIYFLAQGNFFEMVNAALFYNATITSGRAGFLPTLLSGLERMSTPAGFAFLGYIIVLVGVVDRAAKSSERNGLGWELFILLLWPLEVILSGLSGRGYAHYFISWMPAISILTAVLIHAALPALSRFAERMPLLAVSVILLFGFLLSRDGLTEYAQTFQRLAFERQKGIESDHPVAAYLRQNSQPDDTVLVWGGRMAFNFASRRPAPTAHFFYPLFLDAPASQAMAEQFFIDLTVQKPIIIVDSALTNQDLVPALNPAIRSEQFQSGKLWSTLPKNINAVLEFIDQNYELVETINDYPIYRRKD